MKNKYILTFSLAIGVLLVGVPFLAQSSGAQERLISTQSFERELKASDKALTAIENSFTKIENAKSAKERDALADGFERQLSVYARGMMKQCELALAQASQAAKTNGRAGSVKLPVLYEELAQQHEKRLKSLEARAEKLKGEIKERGGGEAKKSGSIAEPTEGQEVAEPRTMVEESNEFFITPEPFIVIAVNTACSGLNRDSPREDWVKCANATVTANSQRAAAWAQYNSCWNSHANVKPKWWRAILRAGCVIALTARLA